MTDRETILAETVRAIEAATTEKELDAVRIAALGKKGSISALLAMLGKLIAG